MIVEGVAVKVFLKLEIELFEISSDFFVVNDYSLFDVINVLLEYFIGNIGNKDLAALKVLFLEQKM